MRIGVVSSLSNRCTDVGYCWSGYQLLSTYTHTYHAEHAYRGMVRGAPATVGINAVALEGVPHQRSDRAAAAALYRCMQTCHTGEWRLPTAGRNLLENASVLSFLWWHSQIAIFGYHVDCTLVPKCTSLLQLEAAARPFPNVPGFVAALIARQDAQLAGIDLATKQGAAMQVCVIDPA